MLLIFCLNPRKDQLYGKPGKYFLARGPVRLGVPRAPMQVKTALLVVTVSVACLKASFTSHEVN